jgi:hypothetical protein
VIAKHAAVPSKKANNNFFMLKGYTFSCGGVLKTGPVYIPWENRVLKTGPVKTFHVWGVPFHAAGLTEC